MKPTLHFRLAFLLFLVSSLAIAQNKNAKENHAPVFIKEMPDTNIGNQKTFRFTIQATDADADKIKYGSVSALPAGATINDSTGIFSWKPTSSQAGKYQIILTASDGQLTTQSRNITITVIPYGDYNSQIVVSCKPEGGGKANGALCNVGDTVTVKAFANPNYRFMNWTENNNVVTKDSFYTFIVTANRNLVANFRVNHAPVFVYERKDSFYIISMAPKFVFYFKAEDPDGDSIKYSTNSSLPKVAVLTETGIFGWRPSNEQRLHGTRIELIVIASDGIYKTYSKMTTIIAQEVLSVNENSEIPKQFSLSQNYPNPFNPATTIEYSIPTSPYNPSPYQGEGNGERLVTLKVYDLLGREIATLVDEYKQPGNYKVIFNTRHLERPLRQRSEARSREIPSGVYFYQLRAGSFIETKKLVLMK